jgi:hypothetical protein
MLVLAGPTLHLTKELTVEALEHLALLIAIAAALTFRHTIQRLRQEGDKTTTRMLDYQRRLGEANEWLSDHGKRTF